MKKLPVILCICIAIAILMSSVGGALLPAEHNCMHEGCAVCLLISFIERLLRSILLVAAIVTISSFLHLYHSPVKRFPSSPVLCWTPPWT